MNEIVKMTKYSRRRFFKRAARELLFSEWICHILAFVIVGACFVGINQFGTGAARLILSVTDNLKLAEVFGMVYFVVSFAVIIPVLYGLLYFEINAVSGNTDLANLFFAFSKVSALNRAYLLFFYTLGKSLLFYFPALVLWCFMNFYYYNGIFGSSMSLFGVDIVRTLLSILEVVLFYFAFVMTSKYYVGLYVSIVRSEKSISECFFVAKNCEFMSERELSGTVLSFFPLFVLSLFTMGFLFVMYTLPYEVITITEMSKYMFESEMEKKKTLSLMYEEKDKNIENND